MDREAELAKVRQAVFQDIEAHSTRQATNMFGISLSREEYNLLKSKY